MKKIIGITVKALLWTVGVLLSLLIILEIALSGPVLTRIVSKIASEYVDGDIHFGKVSASMFRRFPATVLTLEDFNITYPADRFDSIEKAGAQSHLIQKGCSEEADTLVSFKKFAVGVNLPALFTGTINVPYLNLNRPRVFAHSYADGSANWDMFITGEEEVEEDTTETSSELPKIVIGRIMMTGRPHIVYTDSRDTIFAMINMKRFMLNGKINSCKLHRSKAGLTLQGMSVAGRVCRDTIAAGIDSLYLHEDGRNVHVKAAAKAFLATSSFGRLRVPLNIGGTLTFPEDSALNVNTKGFSINILDIPINIDADARLGDEMYLASRISIPQTRLTHPKFPEQELNLLLDVTAVTDKVGKLNVGLDKLRAGIKGLNLSLNGSVKDALGDDPLITADGKLHAAIDSLARFVPDSLGIAASGCIDAKIKGSALLSQLDIYNFSKSSMTGEIISDSIYVDMQKDTVSATIEALRIVLGPEEKESRRDSTKSIKLMGVSGEIAKADISYKSSISLKAKDFKASAKNVIDGSASADTTKKIYPFSGRVSAGTLSMRDTDGTMIFLNESNNSFNIFPKKGQPTVPVLTFTSKNKRIMLKSDVNRAVVTEANIRASAAMNTVERRQKMKAMRDSLAKVYPDVPKDSLFLHMMARSRAAQTAVPEWMKEEDFRKQDIDIRLDQTMAKYFRDWDIKGQFTVKSGALMTPYFPLRNVLQGFDLDFTNDKVAINQFGISSGASDIEAHGELTGIKNALLGRRGMLKLDAEITSDKMDANELLAAFTSGSNFNPETIAESAEDISDEEFMAQIAIDTTAVSAAPSLIVVPGNINAKLRLKASDIKYSDLLIDTVVSDIKIKERCLQITDTKALTNMGDITLEGFYSTQTKANLKTGFSMNFEDITAEKVINLMPSVDTLMPLLKSFGGMLDCEIAATAQLDTNMNILMPSINGIMRISGADLSIKNSDMFRKMAKLLVFKNKKEGHIDKMTVEGVIQDNKVEIFPFILEIDRYTLGLSGVQNMDMSYRYHASLIKSPFLIKLGMDVYGDDFDNMKFKVGKAKYKNKNVPVFSTVIDDTKVNLVKSIRNIFDKGIDAVMDENRRMSAIEQHKKKIGYVQAVDQKLEELSAEEQKKLEEEKQKEEANNSEEQNNSETDE